MEIYRFETIDSTFAEAGRRMYRDAASNANNQITIRGGRAQRGVANTFQNCARDALNVTASVSYSNYIGFRFACDPIDE